MVSEKTKANQKEIIINLNDEKNLNTWIIGSPPAIDFDSPSYSDVVQMSHTRVPPFPSRIEEFHSHDCSEEYYLVIEGSINIQINKKIYKVDSMNLLSIPKRIPHKIIRFNTPLRYITIRTPPSLPEEKRIHKM